MKPFKCSILIVVSVIIGSALGDTGIGDIGTPTSTDGECRIETGRQTRLKEVDELKYVLSRCLGIVHLNFSAIAPLSNIEERRSYFKDFCQRLPTFKECLAVEARNWANCYNDTLNQVYSIFVGVIETSLNKGCLNEGESFAIIADGFKRQSADFRASNNVMTECLILGMNRWTTVQRSSGAIPTKIVLTHKEIRTFMNCLIENIHNDDAFLSVVQDYLNEIIETMNCIHPTDGRTVLCNTIDDRLIDRDSVCPLKNTYDSFVPLNLILEIKATNCFVHYEPKNPKLSEATTIEEFRAYFSNYCLRKARVQHCFNTIKMWAEICLHYAQYDDYKLVGDYLNNVLNTACVEQGKRVATLFHTGRSLKNSTTEKDALMTCLATFQSSRIQPINKLNIPTRIRAYYQALPAVRTCLTDNIPGDGTFVGDVNSFINDLRKKMKCINYPDWTTVLCETLDQN